MRNYSKAVVSEASAIDAICTRRSPSLGLSIIIVPLRVIDLLLSILFGREMFVSQTLHRGDLIVPWVESRLSMLLTFSTSVLSIILCTRIHELRGADAAQAKANIPNSAASSW